MFAKSNSTICLNMKHCYNPDLPLQCTIQKVAQFRKMLTNNIIRNLKSVSRFIVGLKLNTYHLGELFISIYCKFYFARVSPLVVSDIKINKEEMMFYMYIFNSQCL